MTDHTPGPWQVTSPVKPDAGYIAILGPGQAHVCDIFPFGNRKSMRKPSLEECEANARLIAAAPDLLDACKFAFAAMNSESGRERAKSVLVAAIAKATGAEQ